MKTGPDESKLNEFIENPQRALWKLALPIMAGLLVQNIYSIVDMIFVGRLGGDAITALAFNLPLIFFAIGLIFGLGTGATAVIAQTIGAKDKTSADNSAEHTVLLGFFLGILLSISAVLAGKQILSVIGTPPELLDMAFDYLSWYGGGIFFMVMAVFFRSILSGEGDTKFPMKVMVVGTVLNIILDPVFIFVFGLGIKGAAMATVISQSLVVAIFVYALYVKKHSYITFKTKDFSFNITILKRIVIIGLPASLSLVVMSLGGGVFNKILVSYSPAAVAAYQIGGRLDHLTLLPVFAIATSLVTLVGMFYGARRFNRLKATIRYGQKWAFIITACIGAVWYVFAPWIIPVFTTSPEIIKIGVQYLRIIVFGFPFVSIAITSNRTMQGLGYTMPMLVITTLRVVAISAPTAWIFSQILHKPISYVWFTMLGASLISATLAYFWMRFVVKKFQALA
ncbi:MAG: MATE family efflux transporter [FCB group bacterium]|nr:MATE family efflux transporter [FCB group bacterium]